MRQLEPAYDDTLGPPGESDRDILSPAVLGIHGQERIRLRDERLLG